ncbi:hypothetical protein [Chitinilyticum piscinae]|uniref:Uncharacterized protein n=1 Tax=Chitinilyticum piscinae TaxID=2866724 RepID=A0A8J7FED4_9NEIS|nr:hypothetical protein [Chitinilyticum piscinae]MBE9607863.1 hypothetical protein [Chitinilyticum piscinae]
MQAANLHELLIAERSRDEEAFARWLEQIQRQSLSQLLSSLRHQRNPARRWVLQFLMAAQGLPPALRGLPCSDELEDPQRAYEWWLADVDWVRRTYPKHIPIWSKWKRLFAPQTAQDSASWHKTALWVYGRAERSATYYAGGMGLLPRQRDELAWLCGRDVQLKRRTLNRLRESKVELMREQMARRDKSGSVSSSDVLKRRMLLKEIHVLTGEHSTRTASYYRRITGQPITRQSVDKQLAKLDELCHQLKRKEKLN